MYVAENNPQALTQFLNNSAWRAPGGITTPRALELLRQMLLIRRFEERCAELYQGGKIRGFLHLYVGEEAVAAGAIRALEPSDNVVATYREHGHALLRGTSMEAIMAEVVSRGFLSVTAFMGFTSGLVGVPII